jgi:hypothetical protein
MGQSLFGFCFERNERSLHHSCRQVETKGVLGLARRCRQLDHTDILRLKLASEAISQFPRCPMLLDNRDSRESRDTVAEKLNDRRAWYSMLNNLQMSIWLWIGLSFASFIYGGLHLLAWNAPFPSRPQMLLWRISAVTVAVSGL